MRGAAPTRGGIKKILLIFPPCTSSRMWEPMVSMPLGIAYLAAVAREAGYEVECLDALVEAALQQTAVSPDVARYGLTTDQILQRIEASSPDLIGLSCIFSNQWPALRDIACRVKALHPALPLVAGGTHPSFLAQRCLKDAPLDFIVLGEGEGTFVELLGRLNRAEALSDMDGLAFWEGDEVRQNPQTRLIQDLDTIPFPAHDLLPVETYFKVGLPMGYDLLSPRNMPIMTSRGCVAKCTFCASTHHWKRLRLRSPENVLAEVDWLKDRFGIEELKIQDDNFSADRQRTREICQGLIQRPYRLHWNTPNGIATWTLDEELLRLMKKSGCFGLFLAVDSGDQQVLSRLLHKPLKLEKVEEITRACRKVGIAVSAYVIIGFPGETLAQIHKTLTFTRRQRFNPNIIFIFTPLPGSEMFAVCLEKGYIREDDFFEEGNTFYSANMKTEEWDTQTLERLAHAANFLNFLRLVDDPYNSLRRYYKYIRYRSNYLSGFASRFSLLTRAYFNKIKSRAPRGGPLLR